MAGGFAASSIVVVRPPCTTAISHRKVPIELVDVGADLKTVVRGQTRRIDARPGHDDHPQSGMIAFAAG